MDIVVLDGHALNPGDISWKDLSALGNLVVYDRTASQETVSRIDKAQIVLTNKTLVTEEVMDSCPNLKYIGVLATGYNVVDVEAARRRGIIVTNIPGYSTPSVCQFVFALLLEVCSHVHLHSDSVHAGEWVSSRDFCYWKAPLVELAGMTMGIFGFGSIGSSVARVASSFGMNVICHTRTPSKIQPESGIEAVGLDELFNRSDVLSLHSPLTPETNGVVCASSISKMKDGVIVINTARGPLVNETDMCAALKCGKVAAYAADVVSSEPMEPSCPLLGAPNCILTPHIAWATREARMRLMQIAAQNVASFLSGCPENVV